MSIGLALTMAASAQDTTTRTLPAAMPTLTVQGGRADVIIQHTPGAASSQVTVTPLSWWEGCEVSFSGSHAEAIVAILEDGEPAGRACTAEITLTLSGDTDVSVELDRGTLHVDGLEGSLSVSLGRGKVTGSPSNTTTVALSIGQVELWDLTAPADISVKYGTIDLTYAEMISGTVAANTDIGLITTRFPYGIWLDTDISTGLGRQKQAIPSRTTAATHLDAASRVGSIRIEPVITASAAAPVASTD
ncbi:MAG: hypothetical protein P8R54_06315 [Myxococcota bacterium]|nr:hypothetical protein [Myxococcota bacterium]